MDIKLAFGNEELRDDVRRMDLTLWHNERYYKALTLWTADGVKVKANGKQFTIKHEDFESLADLAKLIKERI